MATIVSDQDGLASATSTWVGGVVPTTGDKVHIDHVVELDGHYDWGDGLYDTGVTMALGNSSIFISGTLKWSRTVDSSLTSNGVIKLSSTPGSAGIIDMGIRTTDEIPANITAELIVNKTGVSTANFRSILGYYTGNDPTAVSSFHMASAAKRTRNTRLTVDSAAATNTITVEDATGWEVGDKLVIDAKYSLITTSSRNARTEIEQVEIQSIAANVITLTANLAFDHGYLSVGPLTELQCNVSNLTSNVVVRPFTPNTRFLPVYLIKSTSDIEHGEFRYAANNGSQGGDACLAINVGYSVAANVSCDLTNLSIWTQTTAGTWNRPVIYFFGLLGREALTANVTNSVIASLQSTSKFSDVDRLYGGGKVSFTNCAFYTRTSGSNTALNMYQSTAEVTNCTFSGYASAIANTFGGGTVINGGATYGCTRTLLHNTSGTVVSNHQARYVFEAALGSLDFSDNVVFDGCDLQIGTYLGTTSSQALSPQSTLGFANTDSDPLDQLLIQTEGSLERERTVVRNNPDSLKVTVDNGEPLNVFFNVPAVSGTPATFACFVQPQVASGDGQVEVTIKETGVSLGSTTVLETSTAVGSWTPVFITVAPTKDSLLEVTVMLTGGTSGQGFYIADASAPLGFALNTGAFGYWDKAQPTSLISASFVTPDDVWTTADTITSIPDTMGAKILKIETDIAALETKAARVDGLIEDVSGDRFTTKALEQGAGMSETDLHTGLDNYTNKNDFKADITGLSTFNPTTDTVANVTTVAVTTTNTDMRGTDGANTLAPDNTGISSISNAVAALNDLEIADIQAVLTNQGYTAARAILLDNLDAAISSITGLTESGLHTALDNYLNKDDFKADVSGLSTFNPATDTVANVTTVATTTTNTDMRGTDGANTVAPDNAGITSISAAVAGLNDLAIADIQTALTTQGYTAARAILLDNLDAAVSSVSGLNEAGLHTALDNYLNKDDFKADVSGLSTFNPATDTVANVTTVATTTTNTDMRGTDGANTVAPDNAGITAISAAITGLNDLAIADIQTALTTQGYTAARAILLDHLDADISSITGLTEAGLHTALDNYTNKNDFKADISALALEATAQSVKGVTDQITFTGANVNAIAQTVVDKLDYTLSAAEHTLLLSEIRADLERVGGPLEEGLTTVEYITLKGL